MLMISLLLLTVFMAKEMPRVVVVPDAEDQAVWPGDEDSHPREALTCSVTSPGSVASLVTQ